MDTDDELRKLKARREYLDKWLSRYDTATHALPLIQRQRDNVDWEISALSNPPEEAGEIPRAGLSGRFQRENDYLTNALPLIPEYDTSLLMRASSMSASGTASVFEFVSRVGDIGTPPAANYALQHINSYRELQASQNRAQEVRGLISRLGNLQTLERFDRAAQAVAAAKLNVGQRTAAAFEARTFLDGVQGDLFGIAKRTPSENMTWRSMAHRLANGGPTGVEATELESQGVNRSAIILRLSEIGKDREGGTVTNIEYVWTQVLDHVYTVLGLVKLKA